MDQDISVAFAEADSDHEMESLMLCDNENEQNSESDDEVPKVTKKQAKKLLSDSEDEIPQETTEKSMVSPQKVAQKKFSALIDSDSEPEVTSKLSEDEEISQKDEVSQEKSLVSSPTLVKKKFSALIDSDSEPEVTKKLLSDSEDEETSQKEKSLASSPTLVKKKFSALIDSDSEPEDGKIIIAKKKLPSKKKEKKKKSNDILAGLNLDFGSSSESDESVAGSERSSKKGSDSELSGDESIRKAGEVDGHPDGGKKQRMSAKEAMENMKLIQSESQRMAREAYVDIPYHKPKQHSLKEFLSRKSVTRKEIPKIGLKTTAASIKMSQEELEAYEKLLKEREKEATEFFKSESEEEEEPENETEKKENDEESPVSAPVVAELPEKSNAELLKEMDEALSNAVGQQDEIMSLIEKDFNDEKETSEEIPTEITDEKLSEAEIEAEIEPEIEAEMEPETEESEIPLVEKVPESPVSVPKSPEQEISSKLEAKRNKLRSLLGDLPEMKPFFSDPSLVIDLETGDIIKKEPTGPELLREKYLKNAVVKSQVPHDQDLQIISMENGLHVEHVIVKPDINTLKVKKDVKPGAAYVKLQQELQKKISESRMKIVHEREGYAKKLEEEQEQYSGDEESEVEDNEEENDANLEEETEEIQLNEIEETEIDVEKEENSSSDDSSDDEEELPDPGTAKKNRILKAFDDSDDEEIPLNDISLSDSLPLGQTLPPEKEFPLLETSDTSFKIPEIPAVTLWDSIEKDDDLSELCSGRFGPTQAEIPEMTQETGIKALCDKGFTQGVTEDDLSDLCSGVFVTQVPPSAENEQEMTENDPEMPKKPSPEKIAIVGKKNVILSSDEENDERATEELSAAKKVKKLKKKRRQALEISDDESSEDEDVEAEEAEESPVEEDPEEPEVFLDYDSEENEIQVKLTKQDRQKAATNYFENEAELSGSEYGSADEDEKDLDCFDQELGDEDQFDQEQLQSELGKIHMRRILDQDNREVKILQEMFFEDEENDGIGRTRKFMWKNVDGTMNLMEGMQNDEDPGHHSEDENEEEYRKMRHEREALLAKNNEEKENSLQLTQETTLLQNNSTETSIVKKRVTIIKKQTTTDTSLTSKNGDSPFLISFDKVHKGSRASFLTRDAETLNKLAGMVKERDGEAMATALGKAKNFVFSVVTPPPQAVNKQGNKRPSDAGTEEAQNKRQKVEKSDKFKKRLLDSLV